MWPLTASICARVKVAGQDEKPVGVPERALFGAEHARRLPAVPLPEQRPGHILHERIREHTHKRDVQSNSPV